MPKVIEAELVIKEQLKPDIFKFGVKVGDIAKEILPGQFIEIQISEDYEPFLRRPISVYNLEKERGILEFIFRIGGKGTNILAKKEVGDKINIIGPLGHGTFKISRV